MCLCELGGGGGGGVNPTLVVDGGLDQHISLLD